MGWREHDVLVDTSTPMRQRSLLWLGERWASRGRLASRGLVVAIEFLSISSSSPWRPLSGALEAREMLECVSLPQYQPGDNLTEEASPLFQFALH